MREKVETQKEELGRNFWRKKYGQKTR